MGWLTFVIAVFVVGRDVFQWDLASLRKLIFTVFVYSGQAIVFFGRERRHFWNSLPGRSLLETSTFAVIVVSLFAVSGRLIAFLSPILIRATRGLELAFAIPLDFLKVWLFRCVNIR